MKLDQIITNEFLSKEEEEKEWFFLVNAHNSSSNSRFLRVRMTMIFNELLGCHLVAPKIILVRLKKQSEKASCMRHLN